MDQLAMQSRGLRIRWMPSACARGFVRCRTEAKRCEREDRFGIARCASARKSGCAARGALRRNCRASPRAGATRRFSQPVSIRWIRFES